MSVRRVLSGGLTLALALGLVAAVGGPASAVAPSSSFDLSGEAGDFLTGGSTFAYTEAGSTFSLAGDASYVKATVSGAPWDIWFRAPQGEQLTVGTTYTGAARADLATGAQPGFFLFGDGRGCNAETTTFTVLDLATDAGTGSPTAFAGTFETRCDTSTAAARGFIRVNSAVPYAAAASLTLTGPATTPVGRPVALHGVLEGATGVLADTALTVSRTDGSGTTALADVTTGADGSFTVADTMPATDASWSVAYAGSETVQALSATHLVAVGPYPSTIAITAPSTASRGVAYKVVGVLGSVDGRVAGVPVRLTRRDLAGTRAYNLVTNASGVVSYRDVPAVGGPVTWTLSYVGDATHGATSASKVVTVSRLATAITIKSSLKVYVYGQKAVVTVHLGTTYNKRDVYLYARPLAAPAPGAPGKLVAHAKVNRFGNAVFTYTMRSRTIFTVKYLGDYRYRPVSRTVAPYVRAKVAVVLSGWSSKSGSTFLYRGVDPLQTVVVTPNRSGQCFNLSVQAFQFGAWQSFTGLTCGTLDGTSRGYVLLTSNRAPGILVRIRATVGNDAASQTLGNTSPWVYLKFV